MMQVDMNDPDVIESLKFLLVSNEEKLFLVTQVMIANKIFLEILLF